MIASGAGWPVGGPGSGAGLSTGGNGRTGDRTGSGARAVPPVQPVHALTDQSGRGAGHAAEDRTGTRAEQRADAGAGRALVPVGAPRPPIPVGNGQGAHAHTDKGRADRAHVPVASAPGPTVPLGPETSRAVQAAAAYLSDGAWEANPARDAWISQRVAPASAAAASDSYRRHGGLPPMGMPTGRIFRVSV